MTILSQVSNILLNDYHPRLESQVFKKTILLEQLEKGTGMEAMANNTFRVKVQSYGHSGVYFRSVSSTSALSTGAPQYVEPTVDAAAGYGTHDIHDYALTAAKGKPSSIVDLADNFGSSVQSELRRSMNRQLLGLGGTATGNAKIADVNGSSSSTTLTIDGYGTRFMYPGSLLSIGTTAEFVAGTEETTVISTVDSATQVTLATSETVVDNDLVKFTGGHDSEMNGLLNAIDASIAYMGVTRTSSYWAQSYVDTTNEALSEDDMVTALIEADKVGDVRFIVTGGSLYRKYAALLSSMKRSAPDKSLLGGFVGLEFAAGKPGVGVFLDHDTRYDGNTTGGDMFFVDPTALTIGKLDMGWLQNSDGGIFKARDLTPSWWASYKFYGNLASLNFRACSRLGGKTV